MSLELLTALINIVFGNPFQNYNELYNCLTIDLRDFAENDLGLSEENFYDFLDNLKENYAILAGYDEEDDLHSYGIQESQIYYYLTDNYPDFTWYKTYDVSINQASGETIKNIQNNDFPYEDVCSGLSQSTSVSSYGGCGPIAMIGVCDYFANVFQLDELLNRPSSSADRITLSKNIFNKVKTFEDGNDGTITFSSDYSGGFNSLMHDYSLNNYLHCSCSLFLLGSNRAYSTIKDNIKFGLPVTLFTNYGTGHFGNHYSNIYNVSEFTGYNRQTGQSKTLRFLKGYLNWRGYSSAYYVSEDILHDPLCGICTYDFANSKSINLSASDFSLFVNANGQGQYFYSNIEDYVWYDDNYPILTNRLRCSYIENQYLVLSSNRENAGVAYLDMLYPGVELTSISFDCALWSNTEFIQTEHLKIQYYDDGIWNDIASIDLANLSTNKNDMDHFIFLIPKGYQEIRFYSWCENPTADRNKGRVVFDNICVECI